ncbi:hypothetical protein, partial [Desulfonatronospira sp.]|uniref:hypothetical protein n=1 Tax=Desulfonatronospira sp. TaxID=1962951 RepID=UPI0025BF15C2
PEPASTGPDIDSHPEHVLCLFIMRRDGRVAEGVGLENRRPERVREFEYLSLRHFLNSTKFSLKRVLVKL